jgi:hypothetical protein
VLSAEAVHTSKKQVSAVNITVIGIAGRVYLFFIWGFLDRAESFVVVVTTKFMDERRY